MNKGTPAGPLLAAFDKAVEEELPHVSIIACNSHDICEWFAVNVRKRLAALATKPAETAIDPDEAHYKTLLDNDAAILGHPTESAGNAVQRPVDAVRDGLQRLFGTEAGRVSVEVERAAHGLDFSPQALLSAVKILRHLAETQRSSNANGSDERTISDAAISGLSDTRLETERGAVQPPVPAWPQKRDLAASIRVSQQRYEIDVMWNNAIDLCRKAALASVQPPAPEPMATLARRCLWIAYVWNDHNFEPAHRYARRAAEECGIHSFEDANRWLASPPIAQRGAALTDERAAFEKWAAEHLYASMEEKDEESVYRFSVTQDCWNAWQARAALSPEDAGKPEVR